MNRWDQRYATKEYVYGREPSHFLIERQQYFEPGEVVLMVADGEGRNGVYLAQQGLRVHSVDGSTVALRKAKRLADEAGVQMVLENADVTDWTWYENSYDHVVGIMIQFADPEIRLQLFENMKNAVKPGGHVFLHGYRPEHLPDGIGGPRDPNYLYTEEFLRTVFADLEIVELSVEDREIDEGDLHQGESKLINLVARRPEE